MSRQYRQKKDPLTRAIEVQERGIQKARDHIEAIQASASGEVSKIKKAIARRQVILDALKNGALKP